MGKLINTLRDGFSKIEINFQDYQLEQFNQYFELLVEWNKKFNLTSITEEKDVAIKHFIDSVLPAKYYPLGQRVIDVGTGAGFPGIPLKILFPEIELVLLDSLQKRINFLSHVISILGLDKVEVIHGRAEDFGSNKIYRESFTYSCSRAVAKLSVLSEYCLPFIKVGGLFLAYKGPGAGNELEQGNKAIEILGGLVKEIKSFNLPITGEERNIIIIEKVKKTPAIYPRKAGTPEKKPLE